MQKENQDGILLLVECEDCGLKFEIKSREDSSLIVHKRIFEVNKQSIFLTYYDCPSCGRRHFVQVDDSTSLRKLNEVKKQFVKLSVLKKKGKAIPEKQSGKFKKTRQDLSDYRTNLMKEFTGKKAYDREEHRYFVLKFSV